MATSTDRELDAKAWRKKHTDDMDLLIDGMKRSLDNDMPAHSEAVMKVAKNGVRTPIVDYLASVEDIRMSGWYSREGEGAKLALLGRQAQEKLQTIRASTVGKLETMITERQAAALKPTPVTDPALALVRELKLQELRSHLRSVDPLMLHTRVKQAVASGADHDLLAALEGAPAGFPIVPAEVLHEARVQMAERDDPKLGEFAQLKNVYTRLIGHAESTLLAASGGDRPSLPASAPKDDRQPHVLGGAK